MTTTTALETLCSDPAAPVTISVTRLPSTREKMGAGRSVGMLRYHVVLTCNGATIETPYSMGEGYIQLPPGVSPNTLAAQEFRDAILSRAGKMTVLMGGQGIPARYYEGPTPTAADVLASLFSDASCWESCRDEDDFAAEFGGEIRNLSDARKVQEMYRACGETAKRLRHVFGARYDEFAAAASEY